LLKPKAVEALAGPLCEGHDTSLEPVVSGQCLTFGDQVLALRL